MKIRVGNGIDIHQLVTGRRCVIGGVEIPNDKGLLGHSDADPLLHAVTDAILGASGQTDIGTQFPNTDKKWEGADSATLLTHIWQPLYHSGWRVSNLDCTVLAEQPKLKDHISAIRYRMATLLNVEVSQVTVKATTAEKLGSIGRGEGILATAVVLLTYE